MGLKPKSSWPRSLHQRHYYCCECGGELYKTCELQFDNGSVEPTVGEILTGATSADSKAGGVIVYSENGLSSNEYAFTISIPAGSYTTDSTKVGAGTVVSVTLESGSWAAGTAAGTIYLSNVSAYGEDGECFADNATVNGSVGGTNMLTANHDGIVKSDGLPYPEGATGIYKGKRYCTVHLDFMVGQDKYSYKLGNLGD